MTDFQSRRFFFLGLSSFVVAAASVSVSGEANAQGRGNGRGRGGGRGNGNGRGRGGTDLFGNNGRRGSQRPELFSRQQERNQARQLRKDRERLRREDAKAQRRLLTGQEHREFNQTQKTLRNANRDDFLGTIQGQGSPTFSNGTIGGGQSQSILQQQQRILRERRRLRGLE